MWNVLFVRGKTFVLPSLVQWEQNYRDNTAPCWRMKLLIPALITTAFTPKSGFETHKNKRASQWLQTFLKSVDWQEAAAASPRLPLSGSVAHSGKEKKKKHSLQMTHISTSSSQNQ